MKGRKTKNCLRTRIRGWTSSSASVSRKLLLAWAITSAPLCAGEWTLAPADALSKTKLAILQSRYPELKAPEELEQLMRDMVRLEPLLSVEARVEDGRVTIAVRRARAINEIALNLTTRTFKNELQARLFKYVGQVDSPEIRARIKEDILAYLHHRGFRKATVLLKTIEDPQWASYEFNVEEDYPCLIREVKTGFTIPKGVDLDIAPGDMCDGEAIDDALLTLEEDLREAGYNQQKILKPEMRYDVGSNSALLYVPGALGKKVRYRIDSPVNRFWDHELDELEPGIIEPDAMANEIVRKYKNEGYDDVTVDPPTADHKGEDEVEYVFKVRPGTRYRITNVQIEGMRHYSVDQGLRLMDFDSVVKIESPTLNQDSIRRGIDNLKAAYNADGYWDTKVHYPRITKDADTGQASLVFVVEEGKERFLDKVEIKGNTVFTDDDIRKNLETEEGKPLVWSDLISFEQRLRAMYTREGYPYAAFDVRLRQIGAVRRMPVTVLVTIREHARVKFGDITITGLVRTHSEVVRRELRFATGDWYDPVKIDETRDALIRLGLFSSVSVTPADPNAISEQHDTIPYVIVLREGKPGSVSFGPGWSFDSGSRYTLETSYNNIGGMGRQAFMKGSLSEERRQDGFSNKTLLGRSIGVGYIEPYIFDWPVNGSVTLNHKAEAGVKRWELSRQGELGLDHSLRRVLPGARISGFYGQKITDVEAAEALKYNLIETGDVRTGRVGMRFLYDKRNDPSWPTGGYFVNIENAWARYYLGGDIQYYKWTLVNSYYFQLSDHWVLASGYAFSVFEGVERRGDIANVLPTSERLHAGGADSNRGFRRQRLGPVIDYYNEDEGQREQIHAGGSRMTVFKLELRYQWKRDMAWTTFIDSSNSFFSEDEYARFEGDFQNNPPPGQAPARMIDNAPYDIEDLTQHPEYIWRKNYVSYGLAFNYLTPLGSFNISYGLPWKRCPTASDTCEIPRGNKLSYGILGGEISVNVGANF